MSRAFVLLAILGLSLTGCYYDNEEELYGPACDVSVFSYSAKIQPILQSKCWSPSCHGQNGSNGELITYAQVKATVDNGRFRQAVVVERRMPQGSSLTSCQLALIEKWLAAGAPND